MSVLNLLNYDRNALAELLVEHGEPAFRGKQILQWIHQHGVIDFSQMTNLSKKLRDGLGEWAEIKFPEVALRKKSKDGTQKWLLRLDGNNLVETVFIPEEGRGTLCVSSQIGCGLSCTFCSTARQGFNRNLSTAEIISQLWVAERELRETYGKKQVITNVVFMGMGEPLLNFDSVVSAMDIMMDDLAYGLSKYRVTLSTSGLVPAMEKLRKKSPAALAVSLHAPNDELRNELVPLNKKYPLEKLLDICKRYFENEPRRAVMFEYVMLRGVNDSVKHAKQLISILENVPCKVNLIPFNPFPNAPYECSTDEAISAFQEKLRSSGMIATVRRTRGDDMDAACGQLVGLVKDRTRRSQKYLT